MNIINMEMNSINRGAKKLLTYKNSTQAAKSFKDV